MPRRSDIKSILVIGAGPIVIGQACEFDYSGTQACKALKEEGYRVILINSNPATIMTDQDTADATYIEPITIKFLERIIQKEKPDAILPTVGGQTGLNCALQAEREGILKKYNVILLAADIKAIEKAEDRKLFNKAMAKIGLKTPKNAIVNSYEDALKALDVVGLPAIIRPSFTMGGSGGGVANNLEEFKEIIGLGLDASPINEVQIDQSVIGWKEYEMEVVRDNKDNAIIICAIENIDPMGVHTGDSITVAPALTLTDKEYQIMRNASIAVLREIGVETGGSNVQFAVNPEDGELLVIEMNPRVSRSSALASKATGFPIAKVAAKLAVGYSLDEIFNDVTKVTPASFEPSIDYVVTKIPRFTFEKFTYAKTELSSAMKSVGEAMAIGRTFAQSLQKALRSLEIGLTGLNEVKIENYSPGNDVLANTQAIYKALKKFSPERILIIAQALRYGVSEEKIHEITKFDPWFIEQIANLVAAEKRLKQIKNIDKSILLEYKKLGFSDKRIAELLGKTEKEIRHLRFSHGVRPVFKKVDTCSAEFESFAPYMYSSYEGDIYSKAACESAPTTKDKVIILGGGPNRIGQGIEFDYACVHAAFALSEVGYETIMINCNPETVSTDYDTADRLYFDPLTAEDVIEIVKKEQENGVVKGVIVQYGGQTPLKLCKALADEGIPIVGTSPDKIDLAEDRERFRDLLNELDLKQPLSDICYSLEQLTSKVSEIGFPVVVRPSYVLGGRAMEVIYTQQALDKYIESNRDILIEGPILVDAFLNNAVEFDVDALSDRKDVVVAGIMEHIEYAGIHSGDSACSLPTYSVSESVIEMINEATIKLAKALEVKGLMNVQYAVKDGQLYIIEVNPRASRTVPFVAKATGVQVAKIAARLMLGESLKDFDFSNKYKNIYAVKEAIFPFERFDNVDVLLGPEMKSTGEVMGMADNFSLAFAKAQIAIYGKLPESGNAFISVRNEDKEQVIPLVKILQESGFNIIATKGTSEFLRSHDINDVEVVNKVKEGSPNIVDKIMNKEIDLVINTTSGEQDILDSFSIRRTTLIHKVVYFTTMRGADAMIKSLKFLKENKRLNAVALQDR